MKSIRQTGLFLSIIALVALAIVGVLRLGEALPAPAIAAEAQPHSVGSAQPVSGTTALERSLEANVQGPLSRLLIQLLAVLVACRVLGRLFVTVGLPAVVGEICAGIALGPSVMGAVSADWSHFIFPQQSLGALNLLSQIGVCLFMFTVGMETNIGQIRSKAATALAVSNTSIAFPFLLGVCSAYFLFSEMAGPQATFVRFALFVGISMSITAFPVLARILQERNMQRTSLGSTALVCAAVGDLTAWGVLAIVIAIVKSTNMVASGLTLVLAAIFIAAMVLVVRPVLRTWIGADEQGRAEPSSATLAIVIVTALAAALSTQVIGIQALFGAFVAGTVMPDSREFRRQIRAQLEKVSAVLFMPLYFAFTGLRTQLGLLAGGQDWLVCLAIIAIATFGKLGGSAVAARVTGMGWRESLQLGALMNTRGLMELIALNIGYDLGILSPRVFTILVVMAVITTAGTGPLLTALGVRQPLEESDREPSQA